MAELILRYRRGSEQRAIALHGRLALDLAPRGPAYVVAELADGEGRPQVAAVLFGDGRYLERARAGEPGLCRSATEVELERGEPEFARAA